MELTRSSLRIKIDGRSVTVEGEAYLPGHGSPDFVLYRESMLCWDDGEPMEEDEKRRAIDRILDEAQREGIEVTIE